MPYRKSMLQSLLQTRYYDEYQECFCIPGSKWYSDIHHSFKKLGTRQSLKIMYMKNLSLQPFKYWKRRTHFFPNFWLLVFPLDLLILLSLCFLFLCPTTIISPEGFICDSRRQAVYTPILQKKIGSQVSDHTAGQW